MEHLEERITRYEPMKDIKRERGRGDNKNYRLGVHRQYMLCMYVCMQMYTKKRSRLCERLKLNYMYVYH